MSADLSKADRAALERAEARRAAKRVARAQRQAEGAPPPDGGATGRTCRVIIEEYELP